jgi:hypothetical protein
MQCLKRLEENKMANEMMRIFFPLKIITYPQHEYGECGLDDSPEEITPAEAVAYEDAILAAIAKENRHFENDRGLAEYLNESTLKEKVHSLYPSVEICDGEPQDATAEDRKWIKNYPEFINGQGVTCTQTSRYAILYPDQGMQFHM